MEGTDRASSVTVSISQDSHPKPSKHWTIIIP